MPISLSCRSCGETYSAPEAMAGRQRPCPICGAENRVPATSLARTDITNEELDSLRTVGHGLGLVLLSIALYLIGIVLSLLGNLLQLELLLGLFAVLAGVVVIASPLLYVVGACLCLFVPPRSRAKGTMVASFVCHMLSIVLMVFMTIAMVNRGPFAPIEGVMALASLSGFAMLFGTVLFVLFMARLAEFVSRSEISSRAMMSLYLGIATFGLYILAIVALAVAGPVGAVVGVVTFVTGLFALLRYVGSMSQLRSAIREIV